MRRQGITPKNHHLQNRAYIKQLQLKTQLKKEEQEAQKTKTVSKKFNKVTSKVYNTTQTSAGETHQYLKKSNPPEAQTAGTYQPRRKRKPLVPRQQPCAAPKRQSTDFIKSNISSIPS